jgi:hypothetical protein
MPGRSWFVSVGDQQHGPYSDQQFRDIVAQGYIGPDSYIWCEGMTDWCRAGDVPGLLSRGSSTTGVRPPPQWAQMAGDPNGAFSVDLPVWETTGRALLMMIGTALVIPAPWTATAFYRWVIERIRVPRRPRLGFTGQPLDIWYVFIAFGVLIYIGASGIKHINWLVIPLNAFLSWLLLKWIVSNISSNAQQLRLRFTGNVWIYVGWNVLFYASCITIVGWAWVLTAWMRWICANVQGTRRPVQFNATGLEMLWRTLAFGVACLFIIPIPWMLRWYYVWFVSQFSAGDGAA